MTSDHKKNGILKLQFKPGDEFWIGPVRVILTDRHHLAIQAPREMKIEVVQPWRKRGGDVSQSCD